MRVHSVEFQSFNWNGIIFAKVACPGCNFRCGYCFVPDIVFSKQGKDGKTVIEEIRRNQVMQGACITGGEPTIQKDLPIFIKKLQLLGLKIMIETNGSNPEMVKKLVQRRLVDFVRLDIKAPPEKYDLITGSNGSWKPVEETMTILENWGGYWEAITVWHPGLTREDLQKIANIVPGKWVVTQFQTGKLIDPKYNVDIYFDEEFIESLVGPREIWVRTKSHERRVK